MQARIEPLVVPTLPVILEPAPRIHVAPREQSSVLDEPRIHRPRAELADLSRTTELDPRVKSEDDTLKAWASRPRANGQARRSNCETKSCRQRVGEVGTDRALHRQSNCADNKTPQKKRPGPGWFEASMLHTLLSGSGRAAIARCSADVNLGGCLERLQLQRDLL